LLFNVSPEASDSGVAWFTWFTLFGNFSN
jgi:hypothetical protein